MAFFDMFKKKPETKPEGKAEVKKEAKVESLAEVKPAPQPEPQPEPPKKPVIDRPLFTEEDMDPAEAFALYHETMILEITDEYYMPDYCMDDIDETVAPAQAEAMYREARVLHLEALQNMDSDDGEERIAEAYQRMTEAARAGHVKAMHSAGIICHTSETIDSGSDVDWFREAAYRGHAESQYMLALHYWNEASGSPGSRSYELSKKWFRAAAKRGHLAATAACKKYNIN